jgi:hypothetical protein
MVRIDELFRFRQVASFSFQLLIRNEIHRSLKHAKHHIEVTVFWNVIEVNERLHLEAVPCLKSVQIDDPAERRQIEILNLANALSYIEILSFMKTASNVSLLVLLGRAPSRDTSQTKENSPISVNFIVVDFWLLGKV